MEEYRMQFDAVKMGTRIYAVVEKDKFQIEELEETWVISAKENKANQQI